ncbi:MAG: amino acid adenylation domain-containing protein, partial [Proteobacteria bacterium]
RIGLCLSRSTRMVVAQIAILRAGSSYVPLDPSFPKDRIDYMVQDAKMRTVLCEEGSRNLLPADHSTLVWESAADAPIAQDISVSATDPAYMIYTSGSTGRPKGVLIGHRAVVNFLLMMTERLSYKTHARLLAVTTLSFDIAVLEIFMPLLNRGTIVLASDTSRKDGFVLAKILESERIDVMQATPSTWRMLLSLDWKAKSSLTILCGGEAFPPDLRNDLVPTAAAVWNLYGPTEATVWVTAKQIRMTDAAITVGRPIGNTRLHILDKNRQILPQGIKGEVYIAGDALAEGYWQRPELDAEKFITGIDGEDRLYQTGDIGRINSDGELEIMGRVDAQIKLRGYRIELGEIESSMLENSFVRAGTVLLREDSPGNPQIVAYLVWSHGDRLADLRASMGKHLPDYMIPQSFVAVDRLPLLPNGKIDRKALPAPLSDRPASSENAATNESFSGQAAEIAELWKKALGRSTVASDDDFFLVGGHSLLAIQLLAQINKRFACQLTLRDIFQFPKFKAFSNHVMAQTAVKVEAIPASSDSRLSFAQERMWYVEQLSPGPVHNLPGAWILHGTFDRSAWGRALNALRETHDVLSMALGLESGAPIRAMKNLSQIDCPLIDLSDMSGAEAQAKAVLEMEQVATTPFDLDRAPLIKFAIYKINEQKHIFFINVHHMIWDGWCFDLFWSHMNELYAKALKGDLSTQKPMTPNYADFSAWQRAQVEARGSSYQYWTDLYKTVPDALDLPIDHPRPAMLEAAGDTLLVPWSKEANQGFELQSKSQEATPFMLAMAVLVFTLHRLSGQNDIVIGTPVRGRTRSEFESLLGLFINVLPLRFQIDPTQSFASLLKQVQKVCMDGFAHQDYPFETLLAEVKVPRDESRTPLFTAMFSYQDVTERVMEMPGIKIEQIFVGGHGIPTDIVFWMKKSEGKLDMGIDFRTKLWNRDSVQSFAEIYKSLQTQSASNPSLPLEAYTLFPAEQMPRIKPSTTNLWAGPGETTLAEALWKSLETHSKSRIRSGFDSYSYDGIAHKSAAIAAELLRRGVKAGDRIGLCCDRSIELIQGMFGIMLAGAAYVPFDPNAPRDRLKSMCEQADLNLVVTQEDWLDILPLPSSSCVIVSDVKSLDDEAFKNFTFARPVVRKEDPAYVIFTSGSTGTPKAVQISHGAAIHFLEGIQKSLLLKESDICLALTTVTFDISILEIFGAVLQGATMILAESAYAADGDALAKLIRDENISFMQATPSGYRILLDSGWKGRKDVQAITGGEALPRDLLERLLSRVGRLWNAYGPTEATVWATIELMAAEGAITIGRPLPGYETFILNDKRQLQPLGAWGELFIGGPSLADGYLKDEIKTSDRFIPHSLSKAGRLYATGDIVRLRSDGRLEFKARLDTQVKIRGYRIELEEIETVVSKDSRIRSCAAKVWEPTPGDQRLVLYFVSDEALTMADLQTTFRSFLPKYMWPTHIERLSALPLTP